MGQQRLGLPCSEQGRILTVPPGALLSFGPSVLVSCPWQVAHVCDVLFLTFQKGRERVCLQVIPCRVPPDCKEGFLTCKYHHRQPKVHLPLYSYKRLCSSVHLIQVRSCETFRLLYKLLFSKPFFIATPASSQHWDQVCTPRFQVNVVSFKGCTRRCHLNVLQSDLFGYGVDSAHSVVCVWPDHSNQT